MRRTPLLIFIFFLYIFSTVSADEEPTNEDLLTELTGAPSGMVNASVHAITGRYCDTAVDIRMNGASRLTFERSRGGRFFAGWNTNHQSVLNILYQAPKEGKKKAKYRVIHSGAHGKADIFNYKEKNLKKLPERMEYTEEMAEKGITNISSGYISGQTNIKNNHINYDYGRNKAKFVSSDGEIHYFYKAYTDKDNLVDKIVFPHTVQWHYKYTEHKDLCKIKAINGYEQPCGWITFERKHMRQQHKHAKTATVTSSDGQVVNYTIEETAKKKNHFAPRITRVEGTHIPVTRYEYDDGFLIKRKYPSGRYLGTAYYTKGTHRNGNRTIKVGSSTPFKNYVAYQTAPVGYDKTPIVTHRYYYDIQDNKAGNGKTQVLDAYDRLTVYDYSKSRLDAITFYDENNDKVKVDRFYWGKGGNTGNIICRSVENGEGQAEIARTYKYDHRGNVLEDHIYGNLSGTCTIPIEIDNQGNIKDNGVELYSKKYTYITNRYNLVESECDEKKRVTYAYRPESNLITKKLTWVNDKIERREFYDYDNFGCILREVFDDGSTEDCNNLTGVTERHITEYDYNHSPVVGLPTVLTKKVWSSCGGTEEVVESTKYSYTREGWVTEEQRYDSNGVLCGATTYAHDRFGNVTHRVDPLGYSYKCGYDDNGNMLWEQGPRDDIRKEYQYDYSNRLVAEEEIHSSGMRLKRTYAYDYLGNKIREVDVYGNETTHTYDRFNRTILSVGPNGQQLVGAAYNTLGQITQKNDASGNVSQYRYNIRGAPVEVISPDGTKETYVYNLDGTLKEKREKDGKATIYTYDHFDRELTADAYDANGAHLYQTRKEYNTFHLLKEVDPAGYVTTYDYDQCGRLVKKVKGDHIQVYEYDSLGRKIRTIEHVSDRDRVVSEYSYDAMDRVIETTIKNGSGQVQSHESYQYDQDGNKVTTIRESLGQLAIEKVEYDGRGKVVKRTDPEGRETHVIYRYDYTNEEGTCVPYCEEVSPSGNKRIVVGDLYGRDKQVTHLDPFGKTLHVTRYDYDKNGNKLEKVEEVYCKGKHLRNFVCRWEYDACGRPTHFYEAYGTRLQKETSSTYNEFGKKATVTKPNGVTVTFHYGANGLLSEVTSSDQSIHYCYSYDVKGNPSIVEDSVNGSYTERLYDQFSHVIHERQATGISISTEYDALGRVSVIHHPDAVKVYYEYDGMHLKKVTRGDGEYTHEYVSYDGNGKVVEARLAGNAGTVHYDYDILGRVNHIHSAHWDQLIPMYDKDGNIVGKEITDALGKTSDSYQYDALSQLTVEQGTITHHYENDSLNNRVSKDGEEYDINALNQMTSDGNKYYVHDANGNIVKIEEHGKVISLKYDAFDRLVEVDNDGKKTHYRYDEHHRRLSKDKELYLYHDRNEVLAVNDQGKIYQRRILGVGLGGEIGAAISMEFGDKLYVPLHDHNGNVTTLIDGETGEVAECYRYSAFGEELTDTSDSINPWRFSSKRFDEETGMVFFGRRYYMPEAGRWLTADPLGDYDGSNLYAYVKNRPLTHFDIYGLFAHYAGYNVGYLESRGINPWRSLGQSIAAAGWGLEGFSKHALLPSPSRWIGESCGRILQGKWPEKPSWIVESKFETVGEKPCPPGTALIYSHGMGTAYEKGLQQGQSISKMADDYQVYLISHPTRGIATDLMYCGMEKLSLPVGHVKRAKEKFVEIYNRLKSETSDHPAMFVAAHSRGGMETHSATKDLPREMRNSMYIITLGSATMLADGDYGSAKNVVNRKDWVPKTDLIGMFKNHDSMIYTSYLGTSWWWEDDHSFDCPAYQKELENSMISFKQDWGIE